MPILRTVRGGENLHILFWLIKDLFWVMDLRWLGVAMVLPTVWLAVWICWRSRLDRSDLYHAAAVVLWISANSTWMIGEFFLHDGTRPLAVGFFLAGLGVMGWYHGGAWLAQRKA